MRAWALLLAGVAIAGTAACSGGGSSDAAPAGSTEPAGEPGSTASADTPAEPSSPAPPLPRLKAVQVVAALTDAGYQCGRDSTYAICTSGPLAVWVLTGNHNRPPVISLHSAGAVDTATSAIADDLPRVLELAHVNGRSEIADWFSRQQGKTTARTAVGDWRVELSAEVGTEEPGAHLTLSDKLCKANCQAE